MPFPPGPSYPISNKDVVSFTLDNPQYDINRPVFIDPANPSIHLTHKTTKQCVRQLIAGLHAAGLKRNDTVCIHSFNSIYYPVLVLAIIGAGGICVGTNPSYTTYELSHAVKIAKIRFVLSEPEILLNVQKALKEHDIDVGERLFVLNTQDGQNVPSGLKSWRKLLEDGEEDWIRFDDLERSRDTTASLFFTSGTSGLPKCAMTTHRNFVSEHQIFYEPHPRDYQHRIVLTMPFFHVGIQPQVLVSALKEGRAAYIMRRFDLEPFLRYHSKYRITESFMVPPMVVAVVMSGLADPKSKNYRPEYSLRTVRNGHAGAAPLSGDMQKRFHALLADGARHRQVWGMTETTSMASVATEEDNDAIVQGKIRGWGNVGRPLPEMQMKLVDERGRDITETGRGELCVKGPTIVKGYYGNEKATRESWDGEGYFHTGDVIEVDKETGLWYVVERLKELIKVRGFQVAPAELEGELTAHPDIIDAAVIGIPESEEVELPRAYVVRRAGTKITEEQVQRYMGERLAKYKALMGGVRFVEEIPKLPSGKILKRVLREMARKEKAIPKL